MTKAFRIAFTLTAGICALAEAHAAEFVHATDAAVLYQGEAPADGKFLREKFIFTATPRWFAPKKLNLYAELSSGPGTPVHQVVSCGVGEIQPGWTVAYGGASCNWPEVIEFPKGKPLYAAVSTSFGPYEQSDPSSTFPVVTEAIRPYPGVAPSTCAPPAQTRAHRAGKRRGVRVDVFQMPDAVSADGSFDQSKICIVGTPFGQDAVGLRMWGTITARLKGKTDWVGSFVCNIANPPDAVAAGKSVVCTPRGNNDVPAAMFADPRAKLFAAVTVTFGQARSVSEPARAVEPYGRKKFDK